jgi:hypothetical protein
VALGGSPPKMAFSSAHVSKSHSVARGAYKRPALRSRPETSLPTIEKSGAVRPITHDRAKSSTIRSSMAMPRPSVRARPCCLPGSLAARIEMNTTLSMPRTISSGISVDSATLTRRA